MAKTSVKEDRLIKDKFKYSGDEGSRKWSKGKAENMSQKSAENIRAAERGQLPSLTAKGSKVAENDMINTLRKTAGTRAKKLLADPPAYKKGGTVKKTGMALVHKGEKVLTKKQQVAGRQHRGGRCSSK